MKNSNEIILNNPLPCIFSVCILSCIVYKVNENDKVLAIFIVSTFFILLYFYYDKFIFIMMLLFFLLFNINISSFYNYNLEGSFSARIIERNNFNYIAEINKRKIILNIEADNIKVGDKLMISGTFEKNINVDKGYIGTVKVDNFRIINKDVIYKMYRLKEKLYKKISNKIGDRKAAFITSIAFGDKVNLDSDDKEIMNEMGISHVMSVSGLHMVVVYSVISKIIGKRFSLLVLLFYVIYIGASSSTCRSYLMILIMNLGLIFNRPYNSISSLSLAGIIILFIKPYEIFNLGFVLSFLATFGIILFNKKLDKGLYKFPNLIRGTVATSLSAQIFILPILIFYFNEISLNFILGNVLIVPIINSLIILGNLLLIFVKFDVIFNFLLYISHYIILFIDNVLEMLDFIKINIIFINEKVIYLYIAMIISFYFYKKGFKRFICFPFIVLLYTLILAYSPIPTIKYYNEGALALSYKGDIVVLKTKSSIDKEKIKLVTMSKKIYENFKYIRVAKNIFIKKMGNNFLMIIGENKYLLLVNYENYNSEYDIIDFRNNDIREVIILNDKIIKR